MAIHLFNTGITDKLSQRRKLKQHLVKLFEEEGYAIGSLSYIFCTDEYLLAINQQFLNHDTYTDIITFQLSEPGKAIDGEIYISVDRVKDNAIRFSTSYNRELHRVIFHGALHLCGYNDKSPSDKRLMTAAEDKYLRIYFT